MTRTNGSIITALLITLSISMAQGGVKIRDAASDGKESLSELQATAATVETDADELRSFISYARLNPESHLDRLMALKSEVNKMGREIGALEAERDSLPSWEQQAIDKILPLARETAANTQDAILFFNENRNYLWAAEYRDDADHIQQDSEKIAKTLKNYLQYDKTRYREEQLRRGLGALSD
jgi:chromosome segregation ATPase